MPITIKQIIENERENFDRIHLYREGLFLKAYQHSAFLFNINVRDFRAVKKYYKSTDCDVVMIGFPSSMLDKLFPGIEAEEASDGHICFPCPRLDEDAYGAWFPSVERTPEKKPRKDEGQTTLQLFDTSVITRQIADASARVLHQLEVFSIENATPIECMVFLSRLKTELKKM